MPRPSRILASRQKLSRAERNMVAPLTVGLLLAPSAFALLRTVPDPGAWPLWILAALIVGLVTLIARGAYKNNRGGVTWRTWVSALRLTALAQVAGGIWVLLVGRTPGRYGSLPIDRARSIYWFLLAAGFGLVAIGLTAWNARTDVALGGKD